MAKHTLIVQRGSLSNKNKEIVEKQFNLIELRCSVKDILIVAPTELDETPTTCSDIYDTMKVENHD